MLEQNNKSTKVRIEDNLVLDPNFKKKLESMVFAIQPLERNNDEYIDVKYNYTEDSSGKSVKDTSVPPRRYDITLTCMDKSEYFLLNYVFSAIDIDKIDGFSPRDMVKIKISDEYENRKVNSYRMERSYLVELVEVND